jgi:hypothetical protein
MLQIATTEVVQNCNHTRWNNKHKAEKAVMKTSETIIREEDGIRQWQSIESLETLFYIW